MVASSYEQPPVLEDLTQARSYKTSVGVIRQTKMASPTKSASFDILEGQSVSLTDKGLVFRSPHKLSKELLCLYMTHPDTECMFFEAEILQAQRTRRGDWEYYVRFRRLLAEVDFDE